MLSDAQPLTRLLCIVDHVAADYTSTLIIQKELRAVCNALHLREHPALPPLDLQYADFSLWQQRHKQGTEAATLKWWQDQLDGASQLLQLPLDHPRHTNQDAVPCRAEVQVLSEVGAAMATLCAQERVSPVCFLIAAWAALMCMIGGQNEVVLGQVRAIVVCVT